MIVELFCNDDDGDEDELKDIERDDIVVYFVLLSFDSIISIKEEIQPGD